MKKTREITQNAFKQMLNWLDEDPEVAGQKYEAIRVRLIKILYYRGCYEAEELADETIDRVAKKSEDLIETYEGNPESYFFGVANNVYHEFLREPKTQELPDVLVREEPEEDKDFQPEYVCLQKCLKTLPDEKRKFILDYYKGEKTSKIKNRKEIANTFGIGTGAIRVRAHRLREQLQKCVLACLEENVL